MSEEISLPAEGLTTLRAFRALGRVRVISTGILVLAHSPLVCIDVGTPRIFEITIEGLCAVYLAVLGDP